MSVPVKAYLIKESSKEIRRFTIEINNKTDYIDLKKKICEVFPDLEIDTINIAWKDDEGDNIEMSSDDEVQLALKSRRDSLFRIFIRQVPRASADKSTVHPGVCCDVCNGGVAGYRFKCLMCADYDLCACCEQTGVHGEHVMLRISPESVGNDNYWNAWRQMWHVFRSLVGHPRRCHRNRCSTKTDESGADRPSKCHREGRRHRETGEEQTQNNATRGAGAGAGPQAFNPQEMFQKYAATLGKMIKEQNAAGYEQFGPAGDYLKNIGESVATFLHPLGIDVEVNVEKEGGDGDFACFMKGKPTPKKQNEATANPTPTTEGKPEAAAADKNILKEENVRKSNLLYPNIDGDWTYVDKKDAKSPESLSSSSAEEDSVTNSCMPQPLDPEKPIDNIPQTPSAPLHPDPKIAQALQQMLAMGFTNEGGWLTQLLELKQGNLERVLDILQPVKSIDIDKAFYL